MRKFQMYRFEYLRRIDDGIFLGLKGPRGGIRSFPLPVADMIRLTEAYFRSRDDHNGEARGDVVRLADAAAARAVRRRVALVERLAEVEVQADAVVKGSLQLVTDGLPAVVEAVRLALATSRPCDADDAEDVVLEELVRADPERARRMLDSITDTATDPRDHHRG